MDLGVNVTASNILLSKDSKMLIVASDQRALVYDVSYAKYISPILKLKHEIQNALPVVSVDLSLDGSQLAIASSGNTFKNTKCVNLYDLHASGGPALKYTINDPPACQGCVQLNVVSVSLSDDGMWLAKGSDLSQLKMYSLADGKPVLYFTLQAGDDFQDSCGALAFSPNSKQIAVTGNGGGCRIFSYHDSSTPEPGGWGLKQKGVGADSSGATMYSPDGKWVASGGFHQYVLAEDGPGEISIDSVSPDGAVKNAFKQQIDAPNYFQGVAFSINSDCLAATTSAGVLNIFGLDSKGEWVSK